MSCQFTETLIRHQCSQMDGGPSCQSIRMSSEPCRNQWLTPLQCHLRLADPRQKLPRVVVSLQCVRWRVC